MKTISTCDECRFWEKCGNYGGDCNHAGAFVHYPPAECGCILWEPKDTPETEPETMNYDTPETDANTFESYDSLGKVVPIEFARRLERERYNARSAAATFRQCAELTFGPMPFPRKFHWEGNQ